MHGAVLTLVKMMRPLRTVCLFQKDPFQRLLHEKNENQRRIRRVNVFGDESEETLSVSIYLLLWFGKN